jgi:membrane associated rhomboid family serine protease
VNPVTPVVRGILIACVAVFLLQLISGFWVEDWFALWPLDIDPSYGAEFRPWQLVTYAFLHDPQNYLHIIFNMFALYTFGPAIEQLVGKQRFAIYYVVCVISAALTQLAVQHLEDRTGGYTVGASGGIFGLLLAYAMAFPQRRLMIIPIPVPMPAWLLVTLYGLVEIYLGISGRNASVAHFAHLGGMIGGFALILYWRSQHRSRR